MKKKVCAYCRVSTKKEEQESSYENQKQYFKTTLSEYDLVEVYSDKETGTTFDREGFLKMLYDAGIDKTEVKGKLVFTTSNREPLFEEIYVSNTSRIARNILIVDIIRELRKKKVYINFMDWGKSTKDDDIDLTLNIFLGIDEQTSRDTSKKIREGNYKKARTSDKLFAFRLYGYKYEDEVFKIIPEEADIVKKIFSMVEEGYGRRAIATRLESEGIVNRSGKPFAISSIKNLLHNIKYSGYNDKLKWSITDKFSGSKISKNPNVMIEKSERIPAIISKEQFDRVQTLLEKRTTEETKDRKKVGMNYSKSNEYNGKLICGGCGMSYNRCKDKQYLYYVCSKKKRYKTKECSNPNVNSNMLESFIEESRINFKRQLTGYIEKVEDELDIAISLYEENIIGENQANKRINLQNELKKIKVKQENLLDLFLDSDADFSIPIEVLKSKQKKLAEDEKEVLIKLKELEESGIRISKLKELTGAKLDFLYRLSERIDFTKEDILDLCKNITAKEDKSFEILYRHEYIINMLLEDIKSDNVVESKNL